MNTVLTHLLFFGVGFFQDILITYYYQSIAAEKAAISSFLSFALTLVNLTILYTILSGIETQVVTVVLAYALGNGAGTFVVIKRHALRAWLPGKLSRKE